MENECMGQKTDINSFAATAGAVEEIDYMHLHQ